MNLEYCSLCGEPTGKAGSDEDSLYLLFISHRIELGPLCTDCYEQYKDNPEYTEDY